MQPSVSVSCPATIHRLSQRHWIRSVTCSASAQSECLRSSTTQQTQTCMDAGTAAWTDQGSAAALLFGDEALGPRQAGAGWMEMGRQPLVQMTQEKEVEGGRRSWLSVWSTQKHHESGAHSVSIWTRHLVVRCTRTWWNAKWLWQVIKLGINHKMSTVLRDAD